MFYRSVLRCGAYSYRFKFDDIKNAVSKVFDGFPLDQSRVPRARCTVEDGQLFLNSLTLFVLPANLGKVLCYGHFAKYELKKRLIPGKCVYDCEECAFVSFENLHIPLCIDNFLSARQVYIDEMDFSEAAHAEESTFVFSQGRLDVSRSNIMQSNEKLIGRFTWKEGMEIPLEDEITDMDCCRIFFINPTGTLAQNHHVINAAAAYERCPGFEEPAVKAILRHKNPVLRTEYMRETRPRSGKSEYCCDDVTEIVTKYLNQRGQT